jgi:hypothetical protein
MCITSNKHVAYVKIRPLSGSFKSDKEVCNTAVARKNRKDLTFKKNSSPSLSGGNECARERIWGRVETQKNLNM